MRPARRIPIALLVGVVPWAALRCKPRGPEHVCGAGFVVQGDRCIAPSEGACPAPFERPPGEACAPVDRPLPIAAATFPVGASDWEAEGRVGARSVQVRPFRIDAFEASRRRFIGTTVTDPFRAASGMTRAEAEGACAQHGGRLPTEDEWMAAATAGAHARGRYPWGDTGAVCQRGAWGMLAGPCGSGASGPDTIGAHPAGDSGLGLHDMAGNVAEWVSPDPKLPGVDIAKGGSWKTSLASELRVWARLEMPEGSRDDGIGFRCVYPP